MSWHTSRLVLAARSLGRVLGINRLMANCLTRGYERRYDQAFSSYVRAGDCVWDVGANVGYYTRMFSQCVGDTGRVLAFEPSPSNFGRLREAVSNLKNVTLFSCGLGNVNGIVRFQQGDDELGATSRVTVELEGEAVEIRSGDSLSRDESVLLPNVIKIDVEGYELEVLEGMTDLLSFSGLRAIGVEVHFRLLKERGLEKAPRRIEDLLRDGGFAVRWPDSSHAIAVRKV